MKKQLLLSLAWGLFAFACYGEEAPSSEAITQQSEMGKQGSENAPESEFSEPRSVPSHSQSEPVPQKSDPPQEVLSETESAPPMVFGPPTLEVVQSKEENGKWSPSVGKLLTVGVRIDSGFSGGGAVQQGFSIPSLRLSAFGEGGTNIDYRVSFNQTREYSSALMPQMVPTEAYIDLATNPPRDGAPREGSDLRLRTGMMAPLFNPWWTPDLGDLAMPDYHETHRALFTAREIGAELALRPWGETLTIAAGAFNGSGIISLNTNNAKAFSGHAHAVFRLGGIRLGGGNGTYYAEQSAPGAINYKKNWVTDFFVYVELLSLRAIIALDGFSSYYEDPTRSVSPAGVAVMAQIPVRDWISAFGRWEYANDSPLDGEIQNMQVGPMLNLSQYVKGFVTYQAQTSGGADQRSVQVRLRLTL